MRNLLAKRAELTFSVAYGQPRAGPVWTPGSPAPRAAVGQDPCRVHSMGPGWPKTQLGHETGSSGSCRRDGIGGLGRVCCSRLAGRRQKPEQAEGVQLVNAIYTMYKLVNQSTQLAASSPGPGASAGRSAPVGKGRLVQHLLGTQGERGRKCRWCLPVQKRGENSLNNGTKLRLSPEEPPEPRAGRDAVAVSAVGWGISSSVSFVYCFS